MVCEGKWRLAFLGLVAFVSILANTDFHAPPRFDGAGYSILAESIRTGHGYREIEHPDAPLHSHFPPGYPLVLAGLWSLTGRSVVAAHALSLALTVCAILLAAEWFRRVEPHRESFFLGLSLAVNWTWARVGGAIQSEPLFLLLGHAALLIAVRAGTSTRRACIVGVLLGAATLTRHVGVCLVAAVVIDNLSKRRWREALTIGVAAFLVVLPWLVWLARAPERTQASLFRGTGLIGRAMEQGLFYLQRWPDQFVGPFVEVATVFGRSGLAAAVATFFASAVSAILIAGWISAVRNRHARLVGLVPLITLALLVIWPFTEAGRFLIPLVPMGLIGIVEGSQVLPNRVRAYVNKPTAACLLCVASLPYPLYAIVSGRASAQNHSHDDFDAACRWIGSQAGRPGPVLSRHPGETFWLSGRKSLAISGEDVDSVGRTIERHEVAYLLVDDRYANAPSSVLGQFAATHPARVRLVRDGRTKVYEVVSP